MKKNIILAICLWIDCLFAQDGLNRDPRELIGTLGQTTLTDKVRALRLPDKAKLLGVFDWDRDGRSEIFAVWTRQPPGSKPWETFENHLLVLREEPGGPTRVEKEYVIRDSRLMTVEFFAPPDRRDTVKMAVHMLGGAYWSKVYLLESGFEHPVYMKPRSGREGATNFEFVDLNNDGVYEAVAWDRRPDDLRCSLGFGVLGGRFLPEILVRNRMEYQPVWPMNTDWHDVMTLFTDLDHDGTAEIVSLEDNRTNSAGAQRLAIYKMEGKTFRRIAKASAPWPRFAYIFDLMERGRINLHVASQEKCKEGGIPAGDDTDIISYEFQNGALRRLASAPRQIIALKSPALEFVTIPAGRFWMGCSPGDSKCWPMERPLHEVEITRNFELGKYEVTQGQWIKIMGANPSKFQGDERRPIDSVSREDVQIFLKKLTAQKDGYIYRLPTEAEWEYAARAGTTGPLYGKLDEIAWYNGNSGNKDEMIYYNGHSGNKTHPVGRKKPNAFGLYDMIGNVWEMCSDWKDDSYYAKSPLRDPQGPSSGTGRILRGMSAFSEADGYQDRVSWRSWRNPEKGLDIGFRVCREKH
jgi:formylglycine-generating enzyme required for sulfatase activity